jgi:hypothetical protein
MRIAVVTGNPKPASRTHGVALAVADALAAELTPASDPGAPVGDTVSLMPDGARLTQVVRPRSG